MTEFLEWATNNIFKVLPLKEERNIGLYDYLDSVYIQLYGAMTTFPELGEDIDYISILNTLAFLKDNSFTTKTCKREVFKCLSLLKKIKSAYEV